MRRGPRIPFSSQFCAIQCLSFISSGDCPAAGGFVGDRGGGRLPSCRVMAEGERVVAEGGHESTTTTTDTRSLASDALPRIRVQLFFCCSRHANTPIACLVHPFHVKRRTATMLSHRSVQPNVSTQHRAHAWACADRMNLAGPRTSAPARQRVSAQRLFDGNETRHVQASSLQACKLELLSECLTTQ
ncbi:hypothetical protein CC85DRAFT_166553 [Cutaneotrichosporon oleaginosum]|uniref:Uncharacterized protein n=1 Tax=Cutaneotrichosporon oleaginosum TaxID=879819 RepID=A0A0J0XFZ2_9TREE|nr:uncharacterized protein CC85DRAFT_166553 [Cutaneotrichosporon oleaginosum]KLT39986.1 hypothetical protein CC85DRAFT_166553 [Cutaneotrichosporon oleaginosum]TXT14175.1 hypothetical protein COLE_00368 [Cutaneotrichosporon oleaginosum]